VTQLQTWLYQALNEVDGYLERKAQSSTTQITRCDDEYTKAKRREDPIRMKVMSDQATRHHAIRDSAYRLLDIVRDIRRVTEVE
jgi:hypothetical protein